MSNPETIHRGFYYQHVYSFCELLCLLDDNNPYEFGCVEDAEAKHADDVTLYPRAGTDVPARFIQVKWHVDLGTTYSLDSLTQTTGNAKTSLLLKFYKSWKKLRVQHPDLELWLVSTWAPDPGLGKQIRQARLREGFFTAGPKSDLGKMRCAWGAHLGCSAEELEAFARCLRFRLGFSDDILALYFAALMRAHRLRHDERAMREADMLVREWVKAGISKITAETLRQSTVESRLVAAREPEPAVCLWIHGWAKSTYEPPATKELDWTAYFDRESRRIATAAEWLDTLRPQLDQAREFCDQHARGFIDVRGQLPVTAAVAVGAAFPTVAHYRLRYEQSSLDLGRSALWYSDATPSRLAWDTEVLVDQQDGFDSLVVLAVSGAPQTDIKRFISDENTRAELRRVVIATPDAGPGDDALKSDADALALANEARKLLKQERQAHGARHIRLIPYGPVGFCLFLGQRLNALGTICTYERTADSMYQPSIVLRMT